MSAAAAPRPSSASADAAGPASTDTAARPLRVLMVCPQFHPLVGGYERAAERLSAALVRRGHRVDVVTERRSHAWPAEEWRDGVRVRRLPCLFRRGLHLPSSTASLAAFMLARGRRYDVVHVHQYGLAAGAALALARVAGARTVLKLSSTAGQGIGATLAGSRLGP
ncbi:MAG: hypothetical protein JWM27_1802, partial [Gemmatimonadetes bacterium]|nr:hypothetical protein [Gemmatimonadota bacterium]